MDTFTAEAVKCTVKSLEHCTMQHVKVLYEESPYVLPRFGCKRGGRTTWSGGGGGGGILDGVRRANSESLNV